MKTAIFPSLRVDADLRQAAESVLTDGESLSSFIEGSVRDSIACRRNRAEFIARGLAAREEHALTGIWFSVHEVHNELKGMRDAAKKRLEG